MYMSMQVWLGARSRLRVRGWAYTMNCDSSDSSAASTSSTSPPAPARSASGPRGRGPTISPLALPRVAASVCWDDYRKLGLMTLVKDVIQKVVPEFQLPAAPPAWARLAGGDALRDRHSSPDQGMGLRC